MTRKAARIRTEPLIAFGLPLYGGIMGLPNMGSQWFVHKNHTGQFGRGDSFDHPFQTITEALAAAQDGDMIFVGPGSYNEAITITQDNLVLVGCGGRGQAAVAPSASNAVAITVSGTSSARTAGVTLINIGGEGNGTGGGLLVTGNIRRFRAYGCKFEGGAYAVKLKSSAQGSVADTWIEDCELAWATVGLYLDNSGGFDPVTQTMFRNNLIHNITADGVLADDSFHTDLWIRDNTFGNLEDATEPTQYLDIDVAGTTGIVTGNRFATTIHASAKMAIAAGVLYVGNFAQAEGPATGGGTSGRPD